MKKLTFCIILCVCLAVGVCLKCHECFSSRSWKRCHTSRTPTRCPHRTFDCIKVKMVITAAGSLRSGRRNSYLFLKGCAKTCNINDVKSCRDGYDVMNNTIVCRATCCKGNFCN